MITRTELFDALTVYARDTQADVHPADHPAVRALLDRLASGHPTQDPHRGIQIGDGNTQTNVWGAR